MSVSKTLEVLCGHICSCASGISGPVELGQGADTVVAVGQSADTGASQSTEGLGEAAHPDPKKTPE